MSDEDEKVQNRSFDHLKASIIKAWDKLAFGLCAQEWWSSCDQQVQLKKMDNSWILLVLKFWLCELKRLSNDSKKVNYCVKLSTIECIATNSKTLAAWT